MLKITHDNKLKIKRERVLMKSFSLLSLNLYKFRGNKVMKFQESLFFIFIICTVKYFYKNDVVL